MAKVILTFEPFQILFSSKGELDLQALSSDHLWRVRRPCFSFSMRQCSCSLSGISSIVLVLCLATKSFRFSRVPCCHSTWNFLQQTQLYWQLLQKRQVSAVIKALRLAWRLRVKVFSKDCLVVAVVVFIKKALFGFPFKKLFGSSLCFQERWHYHFWDEATEMSVFAQGQIRQDRRASSLYCTTLFLMNYSKWPSVYIWGKGGYKSQEILQDLR